jgi:hypothetical protein
MIQFEKMVKAIGFGFRSNFFNSLNWKFNKAGYIIKNKHTPIGIEIPPICQLLIATLSAGMYWDSTKPMTMQRATHTARYFSKTPSFTSIVSVIVPSL